MAVQAPSQSIYLLALDASESACSVAIIEESGQIRHSEQIQQPRKQAELMLPMVSRALKGVGLSFEQVTAVAVTQGPGAFTGVRIGCSIAMGLAYGWSVPIVPVSTLKALALQAQGPQDTYILPVLDARMDEVYTALYRSAPNLTEILSPALLPPTQLFDYLNPHLATMDRLTMLGSGLVYQDRLLVELETYVRQVTLLSSQACVHAEQVAQLGLKAWFAGQAMDPMDFEPLYLRKPVVAASR